MSTNETLIPIANETERSWQTGLFLFSFGAYGDTHVLVWAQPDDVDTALETAIEWLDENAPGLGVSHEELQAYAEDAAREAGYASISSLEAAIDDGSADPAEMDHVLQDAETDLYVVGHTTLKHIAALRSWEWYVSDVDCDSDEYREAHARSLAAILEADIEAITGSLADASQERWEALTHSRECECDECEPWDVRLQVYAGGGLETARRGRVFRHRSHGLLRRR